MKRKRTAAGNLSDSCEFVSRRAFDADAIARVPAQICEVSDSGAGNSQGAGMETRAAAQSRGSNQRVLNCRTAVEKLSRDGAEVVTVSAAEMAHSVGDF